MREIKYPIGIQTFSEIRENDYLYVDKTEYIYRIIKTGKYYFLSRPRRFGKSLLISTLEALFKGKRELFRGLAIDNMDWDWNRYPVLHLDLTGKDYADISDFEDILNEHFRRWETEYGYSLEGKATDERFRAIIRKAAETTGKNVVVLIDEYDQPILHNIHNKKLRENFRKRMNTFYSVLKTMDPFIKFAMITGVSRFSKVSIFSGLNNLEDISLLPQYNAICGITEKELTTYFSDSINKIAECEKVSVAEVHDELKSNYDGYHFANTIEDVYNPFSLLNTFKSEIFGSYWFRTGTTSDLVDVLEKATFAIPELEGYRCNENLLMGSDIYLSNPVPLFFQTGYLTIKGYDSRFRLYTLGFPNKEVTEGFSEYLMNSYMKDADPSLLITDFVLDVEGGKAKAFMRKLQSFFAGIPYDQSKKRKKIKNSQEESVRGYKEIHYQNVMFVIMKLMGFYTHTEYKTSNGRIDMVVETPNYVYVMEFMIDGSAEDAIRQIDEKDYTLPFNTSGKEIFKIGANFDSKTRCLSSFIISPDE